MNRIKLDFDILAKELKNFSICKYSNSTNITDLLEFHSERKLGIRLFSLTNHIAEICFLHRFVRTDLSRGEQSKWRLRSRQLFLQSRLYYC